MDTEVSSYRLEERDTGTNEVVATTTSGYDGPLVTREAALKQFAREIRIHPRRYDVDSRYRLVLLGPDRQKRGA